MKMMMKLLTFTALMVLLLAPGRAQAADPSVNLWDEFVFGDKYTLESGDTLDGNLWVFGGNVVLEEDSHVSGDILLLGGSLFINGEVSGDIIATGGHVELQGEALIQGDISLTGASLDRAPGAEVQGDLNRERLGPLEFSVPRAGRLPGIELQFSPLWELTTFMFRAFLLAALAVLVAMFIPQYTQRVAKTAVIQPVITGALGLLVLVGVPFILIGLAITILLIPFSLLGALLLAVLVAFGWISIGVEVGQRIAGMFNQEWALPVSAGIGTFIITLIFGGLSEMIPCIGWLIMAMIAMVGLGAVLLSRLGTRLYPQQTTLSSGAYLQPGTPIDFPPEDEGDA